MLASGVVVLATLIGAPGGTELEAGATVEMRVGQAPIPAEQGQVMAAATPILGLRSTGLGEETRMQSATRILWRPVPLLHERPLFLETFDASETARLSKRSGVRIALRSTYGEEDYTSLVQQFANQPVLPRATTLFTANAIGDGSWLASRRTTLLVGLNGFYRRPLDQGTMATSTATSTPTATSTSTSTSTSTATATAGVPIMPTQASVSLIPTVRHRLDRRSELELLAAVADTDLQNLQVLDASGNATSTGAGAHVNILTVQPQIGLVQDLNRASKLRVFAGMTYAAVLINREKNRNWLPLTPLGRAELDSFLWRTHESTFRSVLAVGTTWFADPALGIAVLRGTAEARIEAELGLRWTAAARAAFTTDLNQPLPSGDNAIVYDETIAQLDVPLRYRWSTQTVIEFGGRWAERGPNVRANDFGWRNREIWAFCLVTGTTYQAPRARP